LHPSEARGVKADPFEIFCLYYLGLSPDGEVRFRNANQVARVYNWTPQMLFDFLGKHHLHPDVVLNTDFPFASHQVDLQLAAGRESPEQLRARALRVYEEFCRVAGQKRRDWLKEIEQERLAEQEARRSRQINN
jgi:hypothetical protein